MAEEDGRRLPRVESRSRQIIEPGPDAVDPAAPEVGAVQPDACHHGAAKVAVGEDGTVERATYEARLAQLAAIEACLIYNILMGLWH